MTNLQAIELACEFAAGIEAAHLEMHRAMRKQEYSAIPAYVNQRTELILNFAAKVTTPSTTPTTPEAA